MYNIETYILVVGWFVSDEDVKLNRHKNTNI